jgi:hypothetical protein
LPSQLSEPEVVYSHGMRDFHATGIGEKGWGRFEIRLKVVTRPKAGWRGTLQDFGDDPHWRCSSGSVGC